MTAFTLAQVYASNPAPRGYKAGPFRLDVQRINFDQIATDTAVALAHSDTYAAYQIRKNQQIMNAGIKVLKVATAAATISLGFTSGTVDYFLDDMRMDSLTGHTIAETNAGRRGYCNTSVGTETIDILEDSGAQTLAGCIIDLWFFIGIF